MAEKANDSNCCNHWVFLFPTILCRPYYHDLYSCDWVANRRVVRSAVPPKGDKATKSMSVTVRQKVVCPSSLVSLKAKFAIMVNSNSIGYDSKAGYCSGDGGLPSTESERLQLQCISWTLERSRKKDDHRKKMKSKRPTKINLTKWRNRKSYRQNAWEYGCCRSRR